MRIRAQLVRLRRQKHLATALSVVVPAVGFVLAWRFMKADTLNRVGYALWLYASMDENSNYFVRLNLIKGLHLALGAAFAGAFGYWWIRRRRRR